MQTAIVTENLTKYYPLSSKENLNSIGSGSWAQNIAAVVKGKLKKPQFKTALAGVNLQIEQGEFFGLLGVNGAGKTTLIKLLSCLLYPDDGDAYVYGFSIRNQRRQVKSATTLAKGAAFIGVHWALTVRENLEHYAKICGLSGQIVRERVTKALRILDLEEKQNSLVWHLSAGQRQKVTLAMAFLVRTPIVFLDEPTVHLDPNIASEVRHFIRDILNKELGQTIVMSTHYVKEAENLSDRVGILHQGQILAAASVSQLIQLHNSHQLWEAKIHGFYPGLEKHLLETGRYQNITYNLENASQGRASLRFQPISCNPMTAVAEDLGDLVRILHLKKATPTLEEVYVGMVSGEEKSA